ncbi:MAG: DUF3078 domain-containing protein [Bacteroidia bacterium]|nr:DUF3078 domain-containing protein [Bacteroidia bacterium]
MKIKLVCLLTFLSYAFSIQAQERADSKESLEGVKVLEKGASPAKADTGWFTGGNIAINFSQVSLTNWVAGGENSISVNGLSNFFANYKLGKTIWDNSLIMAYGQMKQGKASFFKTDDKIEFVSKYGREAFGNWYYSGLVNFRSQFDVGYKSSADRTVISKFLAPAYLVGAIGMDYKPNKYFSAFISPVAQKTTIVRDTVLSNKGAFGVTKGQMIHSEIGGFARMVLQKEIVQNVNVMTSLDLFSNYLHNPQNVDVNWQLIINLKVNKFLSASISTNLIYDDDILIPVDGNGDGIFESKGPRTQFKEVVGIGLSYKLK